MFATSTTGNHLPLTAKKARLSDHIQLHFIVLLYGFTAILGKLVSIEAMELVVYRMTLAALAIGLYHCFKGQGKSMSSRDFALTAFTGGVVALHWILFFAAVNVSNVSVTLGCMASGTLFTSLLEPILERRRPYLLEILLGIAVLLGLYVITQFAFDYYLGIIYALLSAFLAAVFTVLNRGLTQRNEATKISLLEMIFGALSVYLAIVILGVEMKGPLNLPVADYLWIPVLAFACTAYAFVATVHLMKRVSAFTVALVINLEPVYGIILAFFIFGNSEMMNNGFYIGALIILASIILYPILKKRFSVH